MPITKQEQEVIEKLLEDVNLQINEIVNAREDVQALLRIHTDINDDAIEGIVLSEAKERAKTAAQEIINLLE